MNPDPWRRIEEIFQVALSLTGDEREAFLDSACGADLALRQRVQRRIGEAQSSHSAALTDSETSSSTQATSGSASDFAGRRLGVFELESKLGSGGMGEVYRARDTRLHRQVAIKLLRTSESDGEIVRRRLLREARAAAALDHPNICSIYEIGDADGLSFIVMAYVEGETLSQTIAARRRDTGAFGTPNEAIHILLQIAAALAEAHKRGIVHRDIKPANVMLTPHGAVKVLDFGLAALTVAAGDEGAPDPSTVLNSMMAPGVVAGTVPYMSPEQIRGEPVDPRTDIFSFGIVAYELLTGEHPFARPTLVDTMSAILTREPDAQRLPHDARRVLGKLIAKNRTDRYASINDVISDLTALRDRLHGAGAHMPPEAALPPPPAIAAATEAVEFVGRDDELELLARAWERTKQGERSVVLLGGEPGIGKTRIAREFARRCAAQGATVLVGRADQEALIPYQPWVEALTWYVRACPEPDLSAQLEAVGGGGELAWLVPGLLLRVRDLPPRDSLNPESQRYRLFEAVCDLLVRASAAHPVLLLVDDVHWVDKSTLQLLRHLLRRPDHARLFVILTYRESDVSANVALSDVLAELTGAPGATRLSLRGLGENAVSRLIQALGATDTANLGRMVTEGTAGNPFFVGEVVRHLIGTGALDSGRPIRSLSDVGVPVGVKEVIGQRLSHLTSHCRKVLTVAAVVGRDFDLAILESLEGAPNDDLIDALDEAIRAHAIAPVPGASERFTFVHALIRETLYDEVTGPRRTRLHKRVGDALEALSAGRPDPPLADLAHHFMRALPAGPADKAIEYAARAGNAALAALVFEDALRFYDMALQTLASRPTDSQTRATCAAVHAQRAVAYRALGQWALQRDAVERALEHTDVGQTEQRAELTLMLADAAFFLLDIPPTAHWAAEARRLAEPAGRPDIVADAMGWLARCEQASGNLDRAIDLDRQALALAPDRARVTRMHGGLTLYLAGCFTPFADQGRRDMELARASHDTQQIMFAMPALALGLGAMGQYSEALQAFEEARATGRRYGVLPPLARSISMSVGLRLMLCDYSAAEALAHEARELAFSVNFTPTIVSAGIDLLLIAARTGSLDGVESLFHDVVTGAEAMPGWHLWLWRLRLRQVSAELALARGALDVCLATASDAIEASRPIRPKYHVLALLTRARAQIRLKQTASAIADARRAVDVAGSVGDPALLLHAMEVLLTVDGNDTLLSEARLLVERITSSLPDDSIRQRFVESEPVARVRSF